MPRVQSVLLIEPDPRAAGFVLRALSQAGFGVQHTGSGKEGLILAWRDQPDAIVMEMSLPDIDALEVLRKLRRDARTGRKPIYALTAVGQPAAMAAAREAGVDRYILKQPDAVELLLGELRGDSGAAPQPADSPRGVVDGSLLAFLSANGGAGTSTLCLNLAFELARLAAGTEVVVVDLVLPFGSLGRITGADSGFDLLKLASLPPGELTPRLLSQRILPVPPWGFRLLPGVSDPQLASALPPERLGPIMQALRAAFGIVVVDVGRSLSPHSLVVLSQADLLGLVFNPEPNSVANTLSLLKYLQAEDIPGSRIFTIANRPMPAAGLSGPEIEAGLSRPLDGGLPYAGTNPELSNSQHEPYALRFPNDAASDALREIAARMAARLQSSR